MTETCPRFRREFSMETRELEACQLPQLSLSMWKCPPNLPSLHVRPPLNLSSLLIVRQAAPALSTGAGIHRHAGVNLQHHIPVWVEEENAEGAHLLWNAAWLWDARDNSHSSDDALDGGVIGRTHHLRK